MSKTKRPKDTKLSAKSIVDLATDDTVDFDPDDGKDPNAVALGRKGGLKGGKARAAKMTKEERSEAARKAAQARWKKVNERPEEADSSGDASESKPRGVIQTPRG